MSRVLLRTRGLVKAFGAIKVAQDINFTLKAGQFDALIGPNGAGKSTFVNLLTGMIQPDAGTIELAGKPVTHLAPHARVKLGLVRSFQINSLFAGLSVLENLRLALDEYNGQAWLLLPQASQRRRNDAEAMIILDRVGLTGEAHGTVGSLPYGKQRLVEIALALALRPKVLLLDEPAAGVPSTETHRIISVLASLPKEMAVLIIEHDMDLVFRFAQQINVLVQGTIVARGTAAEIRSNALVREIYLGSQAHG